MNKNKGEDKQYADNHSIYYFVYIHRIGYICNGLHL